MGLYIQLLNMLSNKTFILNGGCQRILQPQIVVRRILLQVACFLGQPRTMHICWRPHVFCKHSRAPRLTVKSCTSLSKNLYLFYRYCLLTISEILAKHSQLLWRKTDRQFVQLLNPLTLATFFPSSSLHRNATLKNNNKQITIKSKHYASSFNTQMVLTLFDVLPILVCQESMTCLPSACHPSLIQHASSLNRKVYF